MNYDTVNMGNKLSKNSQLKELREDDHFTDVTLVWNDGRRFKVAWGHFKTKQVNISFRAALLEVRLNWLTA